MVDTTGRGHTGCQLGDGGGDQPVAYRHGDAGEVLATIRNPKRIWGRIQFIYTSSQTTVAQCSRNTATLRNPGVPSRHSDSTDTKQAEVALEFLLVTGRVDQLALVLVLGGGLGGHGLLGIIGHDDEGLQQRGIGLAVCE